ncbi:uncharacterized protein LOC125777294 [Bactrocera dorsalis]|uniref:Uncharacterized protein LOC125777294 n=1 Tax=Bactrocera dorsalis TaxID=27457 RepID=A0ABM3JEM2_BACDO|nr:uncharacterized protein LOC125777294 [Bactrocera dorsalis]
MFEKSVLKKTLFLLLLLLGTIFQPSHAKELDKSRSLRREVQSLTAKAREVRADTSSDEDSTEKIFDGIRFKLKSFASNVRLRTQNTIKYFATKTSMMNSTMLHRNDTDGLLRPPFKRLRTRLQKRRKSNKNQALVLNMEPANTTAIYEPIRVMDTGLAIIGTVMDSTAIFANITNSNSTMLTSTINMTNISRK